MPSRTHASSKGQGRSQQSGFQGLMHWSTCNGMPTRMPRQTKTGLPAGFAQRPSAETTPATGHDTCCERSAQMAQPYFQQLLASDMCLLRLVSFFSDS